MSDRVRYLCLPRLDRSDCYFLWESGGDLPDRVVIDDAGFIVEFDSAREAREAGAEMSTEEASVYDLEALETWCKSSTEVRSCSDLLNAWNLFGDLPRGGTLFDEADARATPICDKLFWGCNLPAMTPAGEHYVPTWTATETAALKRLLLLGLAEFRGRVRR